MYEAAHALKLAQTVGSKQNQLMDCHCMRQLKLLGPFLQLLPRQAITYLGVMSHYRARWLFL